MTEHLRLKKENRCLEVEEVDGYHGREEMTKYSELGGVTRYSEINISI